MTPTDSRNPQSSLIEAATRGRLGVIVKSLIAIAVLTTAFGLFIRGLSSVDGRPVVHADIAAAKQASDCSGGYELTSIWLRIGCANSPAQARRP